MERIYNNHNMQIMHATWLLISTDCGGRWLQWNISAIFQQFFSNFSSCQRYDNTITGEPANLCVWRRILTTWTGAISCWAVLIMHTHASSAACSTRSMQHHNPAQVQKLYWTGESWVSVRVHSVAPYLLLAPGSGMCCQRGCNESLHFRRFSLLGGSSGCPSPPL